jgi:hypothetical protein
VTALAPARPRRLGAGARRGVLLVHIAAAGSWLGIDVVLAVLVGTALFDADGAAALLALRALQFLVWPLLVAGVLCLISGVVLGLGSKWGLIRYRWVAVKLVLNVVLVVLVAVLLRPAVADAAELATGSTGPVAPPVGDLLFPPIVSTTALLVAMTLSVVKPWGRIRRRVA